MTLTAPFLRRFLARHPELEAAVARVVLCGERLRRASSSAFPDRRLPQPAFAASHETAWGDLGAAVARLEQVAANASAARSEVEGVVAEFCLAVFALQAEGHAFSPRRQSRPEHRRGYVAALEGFRRAYAVFEKQARALHVRQIPWQIELASHACPDEEVRALAFAGNELPMVPAVRRPWGDRCWLTARAYHEDRQEGGEIRYRSLERKDAVLSPPAREMQLRAASSWTRIGELFPEILERVRGALPALFDDYVAETCHPSFAKLGLLDYPSLAVSLSNMLCRYDGRPLFGRQVEPGRYVWQSYGEIRVRALALTRALESRGIGGGDRIAILASGNEPEFYVADFAAVFAGAASVGLHPHWRPEAWVDALVQAEARVLVVAAEPLGRLREGGWLKRCRDLDLVVTYGESPTELEGPATLSLEEIRGPLPASWRPSLGIPAEGEVIYGDTAGEVRAKTLGIPEDREDDLYTILFTSGSTGRPKGTLVSRRRWAEEMCVDADIWPYVGVSFQPSAIAADRGSVWRALYNGGRIGFARAGAGLFADIRAIRPTVLDVPPVLWNTIYADYKRSLGEASLSLAEVAIERRRFRDYLGGRLAYMATGGAPSDPGVNRRMEELFGIPMFEGYGTTETGYIARDGRLLPGLDYRLVDRPEIGFTGDDAPHPRGELAVRTPRTAARYLAGEEGFTDDGYFLTGDLVEIGPGRRCRILGRSKEAFKLAGAERITPGPLERLFATSERVEAVLVTGSPRRSQIVVVAVPTREEEREESLLAELRRLAAREGLRPCERPLGVVLAPREEGRPPWRVDNGLLTPSFKLDRRALEARYAEAIEALYQRAEERTVGAGSSSDGAAGDLREVERGLVRLAAAILVLPEEKIELDCSFEELGGDSITTMEWTQRLDQVFAGKGLGAAPWREEPGSAVVTPLGELAKRLAPALPESAPRSTPKPGPPPPEPVPSPASPVAVGGAAPEEQARVDSEQLPPVAEALRLATSPHLLVTGANGLLGSHLVAELARHLPADAKLYALARADDAAGARARIAAAFAKASLPIPEIGLPGAERGVVAVAGHIDRDRLGLEEALWEELVREVGLIYHVAAVVSGERSYPELRGPNVEGTRRLLALATRETAKAFHLVSSLNVALLLGAAGGPGALEETPLPRTLSARQVAGHPAYALTKWASERLVEEVVAASGGRLRASVSRPALVSWSSATGFGNDEDWLSRILRSCLVLGLAVGTDVAGRSRWVAETESSARGLDLVPVDFVARAVARLGALTRSGSLPPPSRSLPAVGSVPTFHVSNLAPGERGLVTLPRLMSLLRATHLRLATEETGSRAEPLPTLPWSPWLQEVELQRAPALPILPQLAHFQPALPRTRSARFAAALEGQPCPAIDEAYLEIFLRRQLREEGAQTRPGA